MKLNKPEILSPAGDMERLTSALHFGADAVYLAGKQFGMRAAPNNFSNEDLENAVNMCHSKGVRMYVTCNSIPHNEELKYLPDFLTHLNNIKADGVIVADVGVLTLAKKYAPDVDIHISTQAGVANYETARTFYDMGAKRVVLARELPLDEIAELRDKTPKDLEIEAFVHGAMCMSFSGRCLLSSYMTGRDANRGDCAQPCRWEYELIEKKRPNERFPIEQISGENKIGSTYIMNSRDMCTIEHIPEIIKAGVNSLKIEGRAKSAYYVASATHAYKSALNFTLNNPNQKIPSWIIDETEKISHRAYSTGFYTGTEPGQNTESGGYIRGWDVVAISQGNEGEYLKLSQRNKFLKGATVNVLEPNKEPYEFVVTEMFDKNMNEIESAPHATMDVYVKTNVIVPKGAYLRIKA